MAATASDPAGFLVLQTTVAATNAKTAPHHNACAGRPVWPTTRAAVAGPRTAPMLNAVVAAAPAIRGAAGDAACTIVVISVDPTPNATAPDTVAMTATPGRVCAVDAASSHTATSPVVPSVTIRSR